MSQLQQEEQKEEIVPVTDIINQIANAYIKIINKSFNYLKTINI
jgi:hypothetical protein